MRDPHLIQWTHGLGESAMTVPTMEAAQLGHTAPFDEQAGQTGMFSRRDAETMLWGQLPEAELQERLSCLTLDRVAPETFRLFIQILLESGLPIPAIASDVIDCCGTGGSGLPHYNTSTTVAFVLAAGGIRVAKFQDRASNSPSGSTEFLHVLGLNAQLPPERLPKAMEHAQVVFLSAPEYYPRWAQFEYLRKISKQPTILNYIAPLLNPVLPTFRLLGVSSPEVQHMVGDYLAYHLTTKRAMVVRSHQNLDELAVTGETAVVQVKHKVITRQVFVPEPWDVSLSRQTVEHSPQVNLAIFNALVSGEDTTSAFHRMVCLNAGAGFCVAGRSSSIEDGALLARDLLAGGKVSEVLTRCRKVYSELSR